MRHIRCRPLASTRISRFFLFPEVKARLAELRQPDTVMDPTRGRATSVGRGAPWHRERVGRASGFVLVGSFALGPDFYTDGTLIMSDRNFMKLLGPSEPAPGDCPIPNSASSKCCPATTSLSCRSAARRASR